MLYIALIHERIKRNTCSLDHNIKMCSEKDQRPLPQRLSALIHTMLEKLLQNKIKTSLK